MAAAADRLSALPDNLLQHILSFAPAGQAAASAVLSRRWRPLWRRTGTVNLDSRPYGSAAHRRPYGDYAAFFVDANAALGAFRDRRHGRWTGLKSLTLFLERGAYHMDRPWWINKDQWVEEDTVGVVVLAHPAAAGLEELRIECQYSYCDMYHPPLASLSCATTLRVLELAGCELVPPSTAPSVGLDFPHLADLRLFGCLFSEGYLQVMVDAAPAFTSLVLVHVTHKAAAEAADSTTTAWSDRIRLRLCLRCSTVTNLVLETAGHKEDLDPSANSCIDLDMPSLRSFRYKGFAVKLSLRSPPSGLALVDLDVARREFLPGGRYEPARRVLRSFSGTRVLKLRLHSIEDIVVGEEEKEEQGLPTFPNLELLELEGHYKYMNNNTAAAMAWLLSSCPAMSELRLRLNMRRDRSYECKFEHQVGDPFGQSLCHFNKLASTAFVQGGVQDNGEISELAALSNKKSMFSCLRTSLRKVTLQFEAKEVNCFQVQLAKFLVENAMVLEEMHVDDGSQFWSDHLVNMVARWRADSVQRRNLTSTCNFRVYQLANHVLEDS